MNNGLYHRDVFIPTKALQSLNSKFFSLSLSAHAVRASNSDRYGKINIPNSICIKLEEVIEINVTEKIVDKIVVRKHYNTEFDISIVFIPNFNNSLGFVKTAWLNSKTDKHSTLRAELYRQN